MTLAAVFLISLSLLSYQVGLMRLLSLQQWSTFAAMIVSVAMLGIGASGTVLALAKAAGRRVPRPGMVLTLYALAVPLVVLLWEQAPFNALEFGWDPRQVALLGAAYALFALPFFLGALALGSFYAFGAERAGRLYAADLLGAAAGCFAAIGVSYAGGPHAGLAAAAFAGLGAGVLLGARPWLVLAAAGASAFLAWHPARPSQFKALAQAQAFPDFALLAERYGPGGWLAAARSAQFRDAPGLSFAYPGEVPSQTGLFVDGEWVASFPDSRERLGHADWTPQALAFHLRAPRRVLVLGADAAAAASALEHGAERVEVVEDVPGLAALLQGAGLFSGARVHLRSGDLRGALVSSASLDAVVVPPLKPLGHAGTESGIYTLEAVAQALAALAPGGLLSLAAWEKNPPRDSLRLFATAAAALERLGLQPEPRLLWLRGWRLSVVVAGREPFTAAELKRARDFAERRGFDLAHAPGLREEESNRHHALQEPVHYRAARAVLSDGRAAFFRRYPYRVEPATDARPFFFDFHRPTALWDFLRRPDPLKVHFIEWARPLALAALALSVAAGGLLALAPLAWADVRRAAGGGRSTLYFAAIGTGYMAVEIPALMQGNLLLSSPVLSAGATLAAFLAASGLGAGWSEGRFPERERARTGALLTTALGAVHLLLWPTLAALVQGADVWIRAVFFALWFSPMAFAMGFLFPAGLVLVRARPALAAWCWGVNGFASVVAANLAAVLAPAAGLPGVIGLGLCAYALAAASPPRPSSH